MAFTISDFRSGELANCSLVLLVACCYQRLGFQQLALDDVVDVDQLVLVGEFALEQVVHLLDDLVQAGPSPSPARSPLPASVIGSSLGFSPSPRGMGCLPWFFRV